MGLSFLLLALVPTKWMFIAVFTINGISLAWMIVYSYLVYRRDPDRISPAAISPAAE